MSASRGVVVNDLQPTAEEFAREREPETKQLSCWTNEIDGVTYSQEPFLEYGPTFVNATCGLGSGKTVMGIMRLVANVEYWNPGEVHMVISPTVPNLKNAILPEMRKWGILDDWEFKGKGSDEPGLHSPNGARVILESADNKRKIGRLRGPSVASVWIDEPAEIAPEAFEVAIGRLRAGDYQNAYVTGTPKGYNWVYHKFHPEGDETMDGVKNVFNIPSFANPHTPDTYEDILSQYDGRFYEQEALGKFVKFKGLVYRWFDDDNKVGYEDIPQQTDETVYGIDWGGTNPSVILALKRSGDYWYVSDEFYERRCTVNDMADQLEELESIHGPGPVYCDPSEPGSMEILNRRGFNTQKADNDVDSGIRHINSMEDTLRVSRSCQSIINEFTQYQYKDNRDEPVKENDHAMDALRYGIYTHTMDKRPSITDSFAV